MASKKKNIYIYLGKVILITLLIVLLIRCFLVESYTISSSQMESSLHKGDKVLIDKTAYGIRMPVTPLTIPFTFDNIFGIRSYSTLIAFPYTRFFERTVKKGDVVIFNNPLETNKPLDKGNLLLSRCVALPGDTIAFNNGMLSVNGKGYVASPNLTEDYFFNSWERTKIDSLLNVVGINDIVVKQKGDSNFVNLSRHDAYILSENLPDSIKIVPVGENVIHDIGFTLPQKGKTISIDERTLLVYGQIILAEDEKNNLRIEAGKLFVGEREQQDYTFKDDYYWVLSDNTDSASDSRTLGFIPFRNIIGKARYIWYGASDGLGFSDVE